jgi:DNA-directed RNA polymerase subunit RPC12/RpoP
MREHGDQYKCETCGKTFAEAGNLAVHRKMHKAGPQTCEKCFKVFTKRTSYRSHLRSHDETRPRVKCPQMGCDKEYAHQGCLNRHLKTVSAVPYSFWLPISRKMFRNL